ncbi:MAG: tripartite tricarboxylate transporter substrate-binding protein [Thermodesulfobacteriota bacterium]
MRNKTIFNIVVVLFLILVAGSGTALSQSAEEFYKENMPTIVANGGVGGGTDFASRIFASYWPDVTGGKPMMAKVMAGSGGIDGLNYVFNAKPDGLTIGITHHPSDITVPRLLNLPGPKWDVRKLSWIGLFGQTPQFVVFKKGSNIKTLEDLKALNAKKKLIVGASSIGSSPSLGGSIAISILNLDAKIVHGYEAPELALAIVRGEIDMYVTDGSRVSENMEKGFVEPFTSITFKRTAWQPKVPAITELVQITPEHKDMIEFMDALEACKSMFGPPGVPAERLTYLRRSFEKVLQYNGFIKSIKTNYAVLEPYVTGEDLEKKVNSAVGIAPEKVELVRNLFQKYIK